MARLHFFPEGEDEPDPPDLHSLCVDFNHAVNHTHRNTDASAWAAERSLRLGGEDAVIGLLDIVPVLDRDLTTSMTSTVQALNEGRLVCDGLCCVAHSRDDDAYSLCYRDGKLEEVLKNVGVADADELEQLLSVGGEPTAKEDAVVSGKATVLASWLVAREFLAVVLTGGDGTFDARSRAAVLELFSWLGVPPKLVAQWEAEIGGALFDVFEASAVVDGEMMARKNWDRGKLVLAAAGGGVLLAMTGGYAAPAVAAGITAVGGAAASAGTAVGLAQTGLAIGSAIAGAGALLASLGTASAAVLFGATGAGLTGWKLSRRWGELHDFSFVPISTGTATKEYQVQFSELAAIHRVDAHLAAGGGVFLEDEVISDNRGNNFAMLRGSYLKRRECVEVPFKGCDAAEADSPNGVAVRYSFERRVDKVQRAVHVAIFVSGWMKEEADFTTPWAEAAQVFLPCSGHVALRWEQKQLSHLTYMFSKMLAQEVASSAASFWFKTSAASAAAAGSVAAMAVTWPIWIISSMATLDNAWLVCIHRAKIAGRCLAHVLADRQTVGQRPVTLVGHSMGARLLVYCLLELHRMGEFHVVDDVILLGAPVTTAAAQWRKVRRVASGRVVNGYLSNDWVLAFLYRYLEWGLSVAGLSAVTVPGIENYDLKSLGLSGHQDYPKHLVDIFAKLNVGMRGTPAWDT